jgi:hypothetical protein
MEVRRIAITSAPDISYLCSGQNVEYPDSVTALEKSNANLWHFCTFLSYIIALTINGLVVNIQLIAGKIQNTFLFVIN